MAVTKIPKKTVTLIEPRKSLLVDRDKYKQKRVAAYCRVSTDNEEQLNSYENQKHAYTEMIAAKKEWTLAGIYADEGISGTRADKRPQFQKMMDDCRAGKIDCQCGFQKARLSVFACKTSCARFKKDTATKRLSLRISEVKTFMSHQDTMLIMDRTHSSQYTHQKKVRSICSNQ